jgi:hypothetical protein
MQGNIIFFYTLAGEITQHNNYMPMESDKAMIMYWQTMELTAISGKMF